MRCWRGHGGACAFCARFASPFPGCDTLVTDGPEGSTRQGKYQLPPSPVFLTPSPLALTPDSSGHGGCFPMHFDTDSSLDTRRVTTIWWVGCQPP